MDNPPANDISLRDIYKETLKVLKYFIQAETPPAWTKKNKESQRKEAHSCAPPHPPFQILLAGNKLIKPPDAKTLAAFFEKRRMTQRG